MNCENNKACAVDSCVSGFCKESKSMQQTNADRTRRLEWNVFCYDTNEQKIVIINIFSHSRFNEDVMKLLTMPRNKNKFAEKLQQILHQYFANKSEHEISIGPWPDGKNAAKRKVAFTLN